MLGVDRFAFYVEDVDAAVAILEAEPGVEKLLGPLPVTEGPAEGQVIDCFLPSQLGVYIERISYPDGMAYEETAETLLWSPRDP